MNNQSINSKPKLAFATANQHKLAELRAIIKDYDVQGLSDLNITEDIIENGATIAENAVIKAQYLYDHTGLRSLAEDTGLIVDALDGAPGVHTARYAGEERDATKNNQKLLDNLRDKSNRTAHFKTVIALVDNGQTTTFEGIVNGTIALNPSGQGGFGYDPIFIPDGYDLPFASLATEIKNETSHRSRAVAKLIAYLKQHSK